MSATIRQEVLMTQLVSEDTRWGDGSTSPTYRLKIRMGLNWSTYMLKSYSPDHFVSERMDATLRQVGLAGNTPVTVHIGRGTYEVIAIS